MNSYKVPLQGSLLLICGLLHISCVFQPAVTQPTFTGGGFTVSVTHGSLAVFIEDNSRGRLSPGLLRRVEDVIVGTCLQKGYEVASTSDRDEVLDELGFQRSGWTDRDIVQVGRLLNVKAVLLVSVDEYHSERSTRPLVAGNYENSVAMGGRLLSVKTSEVLWVGSFADSALQRKEDSLLLSGAGRLASEMPRLELGESTDSRARLAQGEVVAILVEDLSRELHRGDRRQVEDEIISQALVTGVRVPSRSDTETVLEELEFQRSGFSDSDFVEAGRFLNARFFLIVNINNVSVGPAKDVHDGGWMGSVSISRRGYDVRAAVSVRVLEIETGRVIGLLSTEGGTRVSTESHMGRGVAEIAGQQAQAVIRSLMR